MSRAVVAPTAVSVPGWSTAGRTLASMGLEPEVLADITWNNGFRYLGVDPPAVAGARA